jgi:hypothetical protein
VKLLLFSCVIPAHPPGERPEFTMRIKNTGLKHPVRKMYWVKENRRGY